MGALQRFVVGREYVQVTGHSGRSEVRQVLTTLLLLVDLALVAVSPGVPTLHTAGRKRGGGERLTEQWPTDSSRDLMKAGFDKLRLGLEISRFYN